MYSSNGRAVHLVSSRACFLRGAAGQNRMWREASLGSVVVGGQGFVVGSSGVGPPPDRSSQTRYLPRQDDQCAKSKLVRQAACGTGSGPGAGVRLRRTIRPLEHARARGTHVFKGGLEFPANGGHGNSITSPAVMHGTDGHATSHALVGGNSDIKLTILILLIPI